MATDYSNYFLGAIAALTSAFFWAASLTIYRRHGSQLSGIQLNFMKNTVATAGFAIMFAWLPFQASLLSEATFYLLLSGLIGFAAADSFLLTAIKMAGTTMTTALQCLMVPFAALLGLALHGETLSFQEMLGCLLILTGVSGVVYGTTRAPRKAGPEGQAGTAGKVFWMGVIFALLSAFGQAVGWIMAKQGLEEVPVYDAAFLRLGITVPALFLALVITGQQNPFRGFFRFDRRFFYLMAACLMGTFAGTFLGTLGAKHTKVGVATALMATYPIFIIPLSFFGLREKVSIEVIGFIAMAVAGVFVMLVPFQ